MKKVVLLLALAMLAAGCATQDVTEQSKAAVEQRDLLESQRKSEEEAKRAQIAREQEELNRQLEEQKQRQQPETTAEVKPLSEPSVAERPLGDARSQLKDPASPLSKRSVYYDFDRYDVKEDYRGLVEAHAKFLLENKTAKMRIEGNCDERGSTEYNLALGQRRADGVKRALTVLGVPANRVEAVSYGEEKPKSTGQDEDSYAENRRSDISYPGLE
jgi:peptidoglycan-associated lipoprotein